MISTRFWIVCCAFVVLGACRWTPRQIQPSPAPAPVPAAQPATPMPVYTPAVSSNTATVEDVGELPPAPDLEAAAPAPQPAARPFTYRLGIGDELTISVWQETSIASPQRVLPDGTISPPLLGTMYVAGRTIDETRDMLIEQYKEYYKQPLVSINVTAIHSDRIFVVGEVTTPQAVPLTGPTTLLQAIAQAGGFQNEFAEKTRVRIIRKGPGDQPVVTCVNAAAVLAGRVPDPAMSRGDIVFVPARGVTRWDRTLGQILAPFSVALGAAGSTAAIVGLSD